MAGRNVVVLWLGRALIELGPQGHLFRHAGSRVDFAEVAPAHGPGPDRSVLPADLSICIITAAWCPKTLACRSARRSMATRASR